MPVALGSAMFLPTVGKIVERHPGLKLIVDHMAVSRASKSEAAYRFQPELLALVKYPNVAVTRARAASALSTNQCSSGPCWLGSRPGDKTGLRGRADYRFASVARALGRDMARGLRRI